MPLWQATSFFGSWTLEQKSIAKSIIRVIMGYDALPAIALQVGVAVAPNGSSCAKSNIRVILGYGAPPAIALRVGVAVHPNGSSCATSIIRVIS